MKFRTAPTSLTVSPTGEFLATTHVDQLGLSMWSDKSFYQRVSPHFGVPTQPANMDDPLPMSDQDDANALSASKTNPSRAVTDATAGDDNDDGKDSSAWFEGEDGVGLPTVPQEKGLVTLSGLPPAHWKNLFRLELVKERNKPKEAPKKPPTAPFFLQWRSGEKQQQEQSMDAAPAALEGEKKTTGGQDNDNDDDEWAAAWDDDDDDNQGKIGSAKVAVGGNDTKVSKDTPMGGLPAIKTGGSSSKRLLSVENETEQQLVLASSATVPKRRKISHHRSHLASLLADSKEVGSFQSVTDYIATLGPSAIDVELSTLCNGSHDLQDGLPLLNLTAQWLSEACESREGFEAVNSYLHRFLHLHGGVIAGLELKGRSQDGPQKTLLDPSVQSYEARLEQDRQELLTTVRKLRRAQVRVSDQLRDNMQSTLCLLRHFTRMV